MRLNVVSILSLLCLTTVSITSVSASSHRSHHISDSLQQLRLEIQQIQQLLEQEEPQQPQQIEQDISSPSSHHEMDSANLADSQSSNYLPDSTLTPGAAFSPLVDLTTLCTPGYSSSVRSVSQSVRNSVYQSYNVQPHQGYCSCPQGCELDHLISLELGGSNDASNLWPQPYCGDENAHVKDQLENALHKKVCSGEVDLSVAQSAISQDWIAAYNKYM